MVKRITLWVLLSFLSTILSSMYSQQNTAVAFDSSPNYLSGYYPVSLLPGAESLPRLAVKANLLYGLAATFNVGGELRLSGCLSLDLSVGYNPWTFSDNKKFKHLLVQPELRYWIYEPFNGHFLGSHLSYVHYNTGNLNLPFDIFPGLEKYRYRGNGFGFGLSYGYQWLLSRHWNLEASLGLGYLYLDYTRYECRHCGKKSGKGSKHYFGPDKAAISLIYLF